MLKNLFIVFCAVAILLTASSKVEATNRLNNKELARYIESQIDGVLKDSQPLPYKICNDEGCVVVVQ